MWLVQLLSHHNAHKRLVLVETKRAEIGYKAETGNWLRYETDEKRLHEVPAGR